MLFRYLLLVSLIISALACSPKKKYSSIDSPESEIEKKINKLKSVSSDLQNDELHASSKTKAPDTSSENTNQTSIENLKEINQLAEEVLSESREYHDHTIAHNLTLQELANLTRQQIYQLTKISNTNNESAELSPIENHNHTMSMENNTQQKPNYDKLVSELLVGLRVIEEEFQELHNHYDPYNIVFMNNEILDHLINNLSYEEKLVVQARLSKIAKKIQDLSEVLSRLPGSVQSYNDSFAWVNLLTLKKDVPVIESMIIQFESKLNHRLLEQEHAQSADENNAA